MGSLCAATKRANELMAHAYTHIHGMQTIGLRFFTVYEEPGLAIRRRVLVGGWLFSISTHIRD
jgi:nucleoside-diphosphate-sugar epimerase